MAKRRKAMADVLRAAIRTSGRTRYRVAKDARVGPEVVSRFMAGADIRISTVGKIAEALGLELRPKDK